MGGDAQAAAEEAMSNLLLTSIGGAKSQLESQLQKDLQLEEGGTDAGNAAGAGAGGITTGLLAVAKKGATAEPPPTSSP